MKPGFFESLNQCGFTKGVIHYTDSYLGDDNYRIVVPVCLSNDPNPILAIVDTGTPYCIFDPELLCQDDISFTPTESNKKIMIRGNPIKGQFGRLTVVLTAEYGESIEMEATVFNPEIQSGIPWDYPNFIGLSGFLDRIRFAIDPNDDSFYYSAI